MEIQEFKEPSKQLNEVTFTKLQLILGAIFGFALFGIVGYFLGLSQSSFQSQRVVNEKSTTRIEATPTTNQPDTLCGVDKFRLSAPVTYGSKQYFIFKRNSMNVVLPQGDRNYLESGVFVTDNEKGVNCEKLIEIFDESPAKNNIYEFYADNEVLYIMAIDQFGAGSGEGNAKILKSIDSGKSWETKYCFYYTPEMNINIKDFISNSRPTIKTMNLNNPYCKDFILGVEGGRLIR